MVKFSKWSTSWKIVLDTMAGEIVLSEVDALIYVVLSKAEKQVPYGEFVHTTVCTTL
jgi:hypothetical protein